MYDVIAIGVGGVGSGALWHVARRGASVLGLEQFEIGHDRGSSHGRTRIIRQAYFEHPDYVPLLRRAYELWREMGELRGRPLLHEIGLLQVGPADGEVVPGVLRSAAEHGLNVERLSPQEIAERFPAFQAPADSVGVFEKQAGYLDVEDCVIAHAEQARLAGAEIKTGVTVHAFRREPPGFTVETSAGRFESRHLIVSAGPWAGQLLADLRAPLVVRRKPTFWYRTIDRRFRAAGGCPAFLFETPGSVFYGIPAIDDWGLKAAEHSGGAVVDDPLNVDRNLDAAAQQRVEQFLADHLPGLDRQLAHDSVCMYTMSPDEHFIVDCTPGEHRLALAAGLSGHGFKFTGVLGEALADQALTGSTDLPIGFLSLTRLRQYA